MTHKTYMILIFTFFGVCTIKSQDVFQQCTEEICNCIKTIDFTDKEQIYDSYEECTNSSILKYENRFMELEGVDFESSGSVEKMIARLTNRVIANCPNEYTKILEVIGNTAKLVTIEGTIVKIEQNRFLEINVLNSENKTIKLLVLNYFPEAKQRLEYLLANQKERYKFEYKKSRILDLTYGTFEDYFEVTKIIIP